MERDGQGLALALFTVRCLPDVCICLPGSPLRIRWNLPQGARWPAPSVAIWHLVDSLLGSIFAGLRVPCSALQHTIL